MLKCSTHTYLDPGINSLVRAKSYNVEQKDDNSFLELNLPPVPLKPQHRQQGSSTCFRNTCLQSHPSKIPISKHDFSTYLFNVYIRYFDLAITEQGTEDTSNVSNGLCSQKAHGYSCRIITHIKRQEWLAQKGLVDIFWINNKVKDHIENVWKDAWHY